MMWGQPGLYEIQPQRDEEVKKNLKLADHMKGFQVDKLEKIWNIKYMMTLKCKYWDLEDHIVLYKQLYVLEISKYIRMEKSLYISYWCTHID